MIRKLPINKIRLLSGLVLLALIILPADGLALLACPFRSWTSIPCPGCGMTRSLGAFMQMQWQQSIAYHPLGFPIAIMLVWTFLSGRNSFPGLSAGRAGGNTARPDWLGSHLHSYLGFPPFVGRFCCLIIILLFTMLFVLL